MYCVKFIMICLLLALEVVSKKAETSTFLTIEDHQTDSSTENPLTETDVTSGIFLKNNQTDFDTDGDIIITKDPNEKIENDSSTSVEGNTTDISTEDYSTTLSETTTLQTEWRACSTSPCKNGGLCNEDLSDAKLYNCNCSQGYTGTHCQVLDNCLEDEDGVICNKGTCAYTEDGFSRSCTCFFGKFWDEDQKKCRKVEPPCFPNPCHNGTCIPDGVDFRCSCKSGHEGKNCEIRDLCGKDDYCKNGECKKDTEKRIKNCECHSGYYWDEDKEICEVSKPPCLPNPCKNGGTCETGSSEEFNCTCTDGYMGKKCEIQNFCEASKSGEDMTCKNGVCIDTKLSKTCSCNEGYFLDPESHTCKEIVEPCLPNPCLHEGKCYPLSEDSFNCTCSEGYSGSRCTERDFCEQKGGNIFCGDAVCKNEPDLEIYYCSCASGQYFDYELRTCLDVDFCSLMKCGENEECKDSSCQCQEHYMRDNSTRKCEPHFCFSNPCPVNDLVCTEGDGIESYQCACADGYTFDGTSCKAGYCIFPDLNACDQICNPEKDGYVCSCEKDYLLKDDNRTCEYVGNLTDCTNKTCNNGICIRTEDGEKCICNPGFEEKENNCIDLCSFSGYLPEGYCPDNKCESTDSGFRCICEGKYAYSDDGITCRVRTMCDEGEAGRKSCSKRHALCLEDWSTAEGYTCQCLEGQIETEGGICRDVCSIEENKRQCWMLGAECDIDSNGEKTCKCPHYYRPFENGTVCNKPASHSYLLTLPLLPSSYKENERIKRSFGMKFADVDYYLVQRDVRKAMKRLFPQLLYSNVLNCRENENYIKCKVELQFVSISDEDLKKLKLPQMCHASKDISTACLIPPSLILQKEQVNRVMSIERTNPCDADIKEDLCGSETFCTSKPEESQLKCRCEAGFKVRGITYPFEDSESFVEKCKDIDECTTENPCPDNMNCLNTLGSYKCSCKPGYRTRDALNPEISGCVEICIPNPCVHGDCMKIGDHYFECRCESGYNGLLCDLQDESFKRARTNTIIVGAVLGGALLVVIILSIANTSRLKKKKQMLENSCHTLYGTEMADRRGGEAGTVNNAYQRD